MLREICLHYNKEYFLKDPTKVKKKGNKNHQEVRERETIFVGLDLVRGCH